MAKTISKKDIIEHIRDEFGYTKKDTTNIVNEIFDYIIGSLKEGLNSGEDVKIMIKFFGTFFTASRKGQKKFNPHTRQYMLTKTKRIVKFKRSSSLSSN